jgi:hypothetical protein
MNVKKIKLSEIILKEDEGGGGDYGGESSLGGIYGDYYNSMGPYGGGGLGGGNSAFADDPLYKAFIQPFSDIVKTGIWGLKTLSTKLKYLIMTHLEAIWGLLNPFYISQYENRRKKEIQELGKLDNEYANVLKRNIHFLYNHDLWGISFVLNPSLMLGLKVVQNSPALVKELFSIAGIQTNRPSYNNPYFNESKIIIKEQNDYKKLASALEKSKIIQEYRIAYLNNLLGEVKKLISEDSLNKVINDPKVLAEYQKRFGNILVRQPNLKDSIQQELKNKIKTNVKIFYINKLKEAANISPSIASILDEYKNKINIL